MASINSGDIETAPVAAGTERYNQRSAVPITPRDRVQVTRFFDGMDIVEPGVVRWASGTRDPSSLTRPGCPPTAQWAASARQSPALRAPGATGTRRYGTAEAWGVGAAVW
jgi:hypothetical protein